MWHHSAARITDMYCVNPSVTDELYLTNLDGKRGRAAFKKEVNTDEQAPHYCFSEFPVRLFANWYHTHLPLFKDVVGLGKQAGTTEDGGFDVLQLLIYKSMVASLDITCCSIIMSG